MDAHPDIIQKVTAAEQEKIREKSDKDKDKDKVQEDDMSVTNMFAKMLTCKCKESFQINMIFLSISCKILELKEK